MGCKADSFVLCFAAAIAAQTCCCSCDADPVLPKHPSWLKSAPSSSRQRNGQTRMTKNCILHRVRWGQYASNDTSLHLVNGRQAQSACGAETGPGAEAMRTVTYMVLLDALHGLLIPANAKPSDPRDTAGLKACLSSAV